LFSTITSQVISGVDDFDKWYEIPSPGYTIFWTMPETYRDPDFLITRLIGHSAGVVSAVLAHCTRHNIDGFLRNISLLDPDCLGQLMGMGVNMHFIDSYSVRLELFGRPVGNHDGLDVRYVTENSKPSGTGTVSDIFRELGDEFMLSDFVGFENNLTDIAMGMGEFQHMRLFSEMVSRIKSREGTMIGIADWYSHDETYKASLIHMADAALLWGITSGNKKTKYLLPIKRREISPASGFEVQPYEIGGSSMRLAAETTRSVAPQLHDTFYR